MEILLDPNVAYVLLVVGVVVGLLALMQPGSGLLEITSLFCLFLAGYAAYKIGLNPWALVIVALSLVPFFLALRAKAWRIPLVLLTILLAIGGSLFLFPGTKDSPIGVDPVIASVVSILSAGFLWISTDRVLVALHSPRAHNLDTLIGKTGEAKTDLDANKEGSVQAAGELWSARSEKPIQAGNIIRVVRREGFILVVEKSAK